MRTRRLTLSVLYLLVGLLWRAVPAAAQSCDWASGFEFPGVSGSVRALAVFDDGSGPALYIGGSFVIAGGVVANSIAKWDGTQWAPLGSGMSHDRISSPFVSALTVFDDGTGPALYAGGEFTSAGGVATNSIAKWDGRQWFALGRGLGGYPDFGGVLAMAVFDDGSGPALYAGGNFLQNGDLPRSMAKWDGQRWSSLGNPIGMDGAVSGLAVFNDGSGPALYAGGGFTVVESMLVNGMARWDGAHWSRLGTGMRFGSVRALSVFDDGSGPAPYAGGSFNRADDMPANNIAKWNGRQWSPLGGGLGGGFGGGPPVEALTVFDDGSGSALYAGGDFLQAGGVTANHIAKWSGTQWSPVGSGTSLHSLVQALNVFDDGTGPALYAGGDFLQAGGVPANHIAKWNGTQWSPVGSGMTLHSLVQALDVFDDGSGPALYAGGNFLQAGGVAAYGIAKWHGAQWARLSIGNGIIGHVNALTVFDDGTGSALYAGGEYPFEANGLFLDQIAKWNGTEWSPLGSGTNSSVDALTVFDDGTGPALYAGGDFGGAGGRTVNSIAKWNGTQWSPLGSGMSLDCPDPYFCDAPLVSALTVFDDGSGPALYAGGHFDRAGGVTVNSIAKWNGTQWSSLGNGTDGVVSALTVFDDGSGRALYAGGSFAIAGGVTVNSIAKWDGTQWSPLGSGMNTGGVGALTVFDDGSGPALYSGGVFTAAGGVSANRIAKWNGTQWSPLGSGMDNSVTALTVFDDRTGAALYAGGVFTTAGGASANQWNGTQWSPLGSGTNAQVRALTMFDDGTGAALYAGGGFTTAGGRASFSIAAWHCL